MIVLMGHFGTPPNALHVRIPAHGLRVNELHNLTGFAVLYTVFVLAVAV